MQCVRETIQNVSDAFSKEEVYELAKELDILNKYLYKIHNAQKRFKFYQAFRKVDRNMRKFTEINLKQFCTRMLELLSDNEDFNEAYAKEYHLKFETLLKRSIILLDIVNNNCMEGFSRFEKRLIFNKIVLYSILIVKFSLFCFI